MRRGSLWAVAAAVLAVILAGGGPGTRADDPRTDDGALARFLEGADVPLESYRGRRRLQAINRRHGVSGWIEAVVSFDASTGFRYEVVDEGGSGLVRGRVLRTLLAAEADITARSHRHALSTDNYDFLEPGRPTRDGLLRIGIVPRRREHLLVEGFIFLAPDDGDLIRIEGRLVRRPSFWTRRVDVVRRYGRVNGVRVPIETHSNAHVLLVGVSSLTMCYEYESVNGVPIEAPTSCS